MKKLLLLTMSLTVIGLITSCGGLGLNSQSVEEKMIADILAFPEMQFENAAAIIESYPTDAEPFYTVQAGSDMDDHFATSFRFHVYTNPEYKIMYYDIIMDTEISLAEWRGNVSGVSSNKFYAWVKFSGTEPNGELRLLIDDVIMINGDDMESLKKYGIDPENVANDYALYNEVEDWVSIITLPETTYKIVAYDDDGIPDRYDADKARFKKHMTQRNGFYILAIVTVENEHLIAIDEQYVP
jgi:hypothetical protein